MIPVAIRIALPVITANMSNSIVSKEYSTTVIFILLTPISSIVSSKITQSWRQQPHRSFQSDPAPYPDYLQKAAETPRNTLAEEVC